MSANRGLTLTASTCMVLENIRLALEVWTGSRIRFKHLEFDFLPKSGHGSIFIGDAKEPLAFGFINNEDSTTFFNVEGMGWLYSQFESSGQVWVTPSSFDQNCMVGTSSTDRREEPRSLLP